MTSSRPRAAARPRSRSARPARPHTARPAAQRPAPRRPELPALREVRTTDLPSFAQLGLPVPVVKALARGGVTTPFPIQAATIPDAIAGRDVLGRAATGSGKTLAFGLPLLARLVGGRAEATRPRGLVLVPTRELAMQVVDALSPVSDALGLRTRLVAGGLPIGKQVDALARGVDVLVATPGRLEDLLARHAARLDRVEVVVLDEADHMADLGFLPVVKRLLDQTPSDGQRLLFSATLDGDVAQLVERYLTDPVGHALPSALPDLGRLSHHVLRVEREDRTAVAAAILAREGRTIAFVRTKHGADRWKKQLGRLGVAAGVLHGGRTQPQRTKALEAFRDGSVPVLVATDVAARGIHVDDVSLVLHIDPPADPKDYQHRSGRTARAGESGTVVLFTSRETERDDRKMLAAADVRADVHDVTGPDDAHVVSVTGARAPSGVPVAPPAAPQQNRPKARPAQAGRPDAPTSHSRGDRRPRRERRPR